MDAHELAEKVRNDEITEELFKEIMDWCNSHTDDMDLSNDDEAELYRFTTWILMKPYKIIQWDEKDVNILLNFFAKNAIISYGLDKNTSVKMLNLNEYEKNMGASRASCVSHDDNTYDLVYSPGVKDLLLSKDNDKILRGFQTLFHEIVHALQNTTMRTEECITSKLYFMVMETIARKADSKFYNTNYEHLLKENHAEKVGLDMALDYIRMFAPELYEMYDQKEIEERKNKYNAKFYAEEIYLYGKNGKGVEQIDLACSDYLKLHPEVLKTYPILQYGFNLDGTKKTLQQLLEERQQFISEGKSTDEVNEFYMTLANLKHYTRGTPYGTKEEILFLCEYVRETGTADEFIYDLMGYRLKNRTSMEPAKIEAFIQGERDAATKIREESSEQEYLSTDSQMKVSEDKTQESSEIKGSTMGILKEAASNCSALAQQEAVEKIVSEMEREIQLSKTKDAIQH